MTELQVCAGTAGWAAADDDREQIERAKRDPQAFAVLYRTHYRAVAGYVYRRTGDQHVTEDLAADVFLTALRCLPRYRHRGVPIRYWLLRIATNEVNRWARRQRSRAAAMVSMDCTGPLAAREMIEPDAADRERAQRAILQLSPKHQAVLSLHYLEGMGIQEVAAVIGCRPGTVKSRLSRAREALRQKLEEGGPRHA